MPGENAIWVGIENLPFHVLPCHYDFTLPGISLFIHLIMQIQSFASVCF